MSNQMPDYLPTPEQIQQECEAIRSEWPQHRINTKGIVHESKATDQLKSSRSNKNNVYQKRVHKSHYKATDATTD